MDHVNQNTTGETPERFDWDCQFDVDIVSADEIEAKAVIGSTYEVEVTQIVRTAMTTLTTSGTLLSAGVDVSVSLTTDRNNPASWSGARATVYQNLSGGYPGIRFHKYPQNLETDSGEPVTPTTMAQLLYKRLGEDNDWKENLLGQLAPLTPEYLELLLPAGEHPVHNESSISESPEPSDSEDAAPLHQSEETMENNPSTLASAIGDRQMDEIQGSEGEAPDSNDEWVNEDEALDSLSFDDDLDKDIEQTVQALEQDTKPIADNLHKDEDAHADPGPSYDAGVGVEQTVSPALPVDTLETAIKETPVVGDAPVLSNSNQPEATSYETQDVGENSIARLPELSRIIVETDSGPDLEFDGRLLGSMQLRGSDFEETKLYQTRGGAFVVQISSGKAEVYAPEAASEVFEIFGYDARAKAMYRAGGLKCVRWID